MDLPAPITRSPGSDDHDLLGVLDGEFFGDHHSRSEGDPTVGSTGINGGLSLRMTGMYLPVIGIGKVVHTPVPRRAWRSDRRQHELLAEGVRQADEVVAVAIRLPVQSA